MDESGSSSAKSSVEQDVPQIFSTLVKGVISGIKGLTSLAFALSFTLLSLFFLLKDGPMMRRWVDRHLGVPPPVADADHRRRDPLAAGLLPGRHDRRGIQRRWSSASPRSYSACRWRARSAVVTFMTAYVPYVGAFVAGGFAVVIALGLEGTTTALVMLLVVILANGLLQNIVQPFAMGAALDLHPLVVLVLTIGAGCIFGMLGLVLAAPIASAVVHISRDLARARAAAAAPEEDGPVTVADAPA